MSLPEALEARIQSTVKQHPVVLFMKGTPAQPQCGFSATVVGILGNLISDYHTVDVLQDQDIREGIKVYSEWPTIPQLYVDGEFVGGCDLIQQMYNSGDLHRALGQEPVSATVPEITITDAAAAAIREVMAGHDNLAVHLKIDPAFQHEFSLAGAKGHEIVAQSNGIAVCFDLDSANRANGLTIDMAETPDGQGFAIDNPNAPPPVKSMSVEELKSLFDAGGEVQLFDVREQSEYDIASINGARLLNEDIIAEIDQLPRDTQLIFHCHSGVRSQQAAAYFRAHGFTDVYNLEGGIDAWSERIDDSVPRY